MGRELKKGPYVNTIPKEWDEDEKKLLSELRKDKKTLTEICKILDRSLPSVRYQIKVSKKGTKTYNEENLDEKIATNYDFVSFLRPESVIDVYAGRASIYTKLAVKSIISNDKDLESNTHYHLDALKFLCTMYLQNNKADLIDLDPYGSAYECFDLAIKMAKKGLIVTLGEIGQKRFGRLDFVRSHYGINSLEELTSERMIQTIQQIGRQNKKELTIWKVKDWRLTSRVYFTIKPLKITEQWEKH